MRNLVQLREAAAVLTIVSSHCGINIFISWYILVVLADYHISLVSGGRQYGHCTRHWHV